MDNWVVRTRLATLLVSLALGGVALALILTGKLTFGDRSGEDEESVATVSTSAERVDRFNENRAFRYLTSQVERGPRPAGSPASRELGEWLKGKLPGGRFQDVPGGLRNVIGEVRGRDPDRLVVVGAHYDTKDIPGFVGANDGASGVATVVELARTVEERPLDATVVFVLFDGEESPPGSPDADLYEKGLRGSKIAAPVYDDAQMMVLLDLVGDRDLSIPREANSERGLWSRLREAAEQVGYRDDFPSGTRSGILDDHIPFQRQGVPSIDLIDFEFSCFHRTCDDLDVVGRTSLDAAGETVLQLLRRL